MFEQLLLGRPEALYTDALDHKDRYDEPTVELLAELVATQRAPTDRERLLLDQATFDFATTKTAPTDHVKPPPMKKPKKRDEDDEEEEPGDAASVPLEAIPPFWWR